QLLGADFAGITLGTSPLVVAPGMTAFAPEAGLQVGQALPALLGGELDQLTDTAHGLALMEVPTIDATRGQPIRPTASLWVSPGGAHVFDAGTFAWTWGLDPRYAAALPGFPAVAFAHLTAQVIAWAGTPPRGSAGAFSSGP
ncbi:MAG TPA: N,N-dimethylformamidase beta subunit family domain-containing protein, partial [Candidatus Limnocylindrales bacterium]|nr:N,N-dimethylformamidase beta subunit family domain-containing protein [Candidatus Limnocylindrales bacterium]